MTFGRSRRLASPLQKLALALRDGGFCVKPGCSTPWHRCDADHIIEWDDGGLTDIENLRHLCRTDCHPHRHETGTEMTRQRDGTWTINNETLPPLPSWPPPRPTIHQPDPPPTTSNDSKTTTAPPDDPSPSLSNRPQSSPVP